MIAQELQLSVGWGGGLRRALLGDDCAVYLDGSVSSIGAFTGVCVCYSLSRV